MPDFEELVAAVSEEETEAFVKQKRDGLERYKQELRGDLLRQLEQRRQKVKTTLILRLATGAVQRTEDVMGNTKRWSYKSPQVSSTRGKDYA